jgi:hypothetical protein
MSTAETKICQNCNKDFVIEPDDFAFYEKIKVPAPTFCPECRFQRRSSYRNERKAFFNISLKSGKKVFSLYSKQSKIPIYTDDEWRQDDWDAMQYGQDYDFSKPFFEQFHKLANSVPHWASSCSVGNLRSDFVINSDYAKDSYLIFDASNMESCAYCNASHYCKECFDVSGVNNCERSYDLFWSTKCNRTHFSSQCTDCANVIFCKNCKGCIDCFGCVNLRNKSHCFFNEQLSKDDYQKCIAELQINTWSGYMDVKEKAQKFWLKFPVKYIQGINNSNVLGEYISNSRNIYMGYLVQGAENLRYCQEQMFPGAKDSMDISVWGSPSEVCYENAICGYGCFNSKFCVECWPQNINLEYCMFMMNCSDCFGCFGLKNKKHCIFNKQYAEEEYKMLVAKIKKQMDEIPYTNKKGRVYKYGEFFPVEHSPFGYNTSVANDHFPLTREQALELGYIWDDIEGTEYETNMDADELPESINYIKDDIISKRIACKKCNRAYRVIKSELDFLRHEGLPFPRLCVDCRFADRLSQKNKSQLYHRKCMNPGCNNEFETSYAPDRQEIVYCEECYTREVV